MFYYDIFITKTVIAVYQYYSINQKKECIVVNSPTKTNISWVYQKYHNSKTQGSNPNPRPSKEKSRYTHESYKKKKKDYSGYKRTIKKLCRNIK